MRPLRTRIRRWASHLPDGLVAIGILLLGLSLACLPWAAIILGLVQLLRLAEGHEKWINVIGGLMWALGLGLALPIFFLFACIAEILETWVGTRCPSCGQRELEWHGGSWKYGDPPAYRYFECINCGAMFRQLYGGQGVLSELERLSSIPGETPASDPPGP